MNPHTEELPNKYIQNPPEGMTSEDIRSMSEDMTDNLLCLPLRSQSYKVRKALLTQSFPYFIALTDTQYCRFRICAS